MLTIEFEDYPVLNLYLNMSLKNQLKHNLKQAEKATTMVALEF